MNITRHLYLSTACRAPDEPAAPEPEVIAPIAEVIAPEPEPQPEPEPAPEPVIAEEPAQKKTPWFQRVIAEVREEKSQERSLREAAEQRAADLQAIIERMQGGEKLEPIDRPPPRKTEQDVETLVEARAARKLFDADCGVVAQKWKAESEDFQAHKSVLDSVGLMPRADGSNTEFLLDVFAVVDKDGAHTLLDKLAKDPEKAASLVGMESRRRIAELTRMADAPKTEVKPAAEAPKPAISKAPAPKPVISPLAAAADVDPTTPEGNEKLSDQQWEKWYKAKYVKTA